MVVFAAPQGLSDTEFAAWLRMFNAQGPLIGGRDPAITTRARQLGLLGDASTSGTPAQSAIGGFNSIGGFSAPQPGKLGEIELARLTMLESLKRVKANRAKSRATFPDLFPEATNITKGAL